MNKQQIKQILEEEADLDKAVEQILALDKPKKSKVESTVIQKQLGYEILSFKDKYSNRIMTKTGNTEWVFQYNKPNIKTLQFSSDGWYLTEHHLLKNPNWIIHSLKRFSDDEIFTIGDSYNLGIIKEIVIDGGSIKFHNDTGSWSGLYVTKKVEIKKPLFKTEDGVDIFEGDNYYWLYKNLRISSGIIHGPYKARVLERFELYCDSNFYFSTKEAAEGYLILNKPCLSIKEIIEELELPKIHTKTLLLKQLVKSKL